MEFFNSLEHCATKVDIYGRYSPLLENTHNKGS
jgi:hypothetical protein